MTVKRRVAPSDDLARSGGVDPAPRPGERLSVRDYDPDPEDDEEAVHESRV
jgi:hypothetical protein